MKYTVGDMFAGVGGIALGFESSGFDVLWANEYDSNACKTYRNNFKHKLHEADVSKLSPSDLGCVDVITSGFPCQAFSIAGKREGFKDEKGRGNLFFETARFIDELRPKAFLLENVKNLVSHDKGDTFEVIRNCIEKDLGYSFIYFILNGYLHGGIPQNRERVYMVGFKDEAGFPEHSDQKYLFYDEKHYNSCTYDFIIPQPIKLKKTIKDIIDRRRKPSKYYFNKDHPYIPELKKVINSDDTLYQWRRTHVRINKKGLCPTLTANMGSGGHNVPLLKDHWGYRRLTPKECFKFQGFPDEFSLPEGVSDAQLYKQAGNSVVVPVIERIALEINRVLTKQKSLSNL